MKPSKREKLERAGFKVGTVQEFLHLSDEEMALIDLKVRLIEMLKAVRNDNRITQHQLAKLLGSSQSRVANLTFARSPQNEGGGSQLLAIAVRQRGLRLSERCGGDLPS